MKLDLKGWQKVSSTKDHSVLRNKDGHEMKIAHKPLKPKMRAQLAELPTAFAEGGEATFVEEQKPVQPSSADVATAMQAPPAATAPVTINIATPQMPAAIPQMQQAPAPQPFTMEGPAQALAPNINAPAPQMAPPPSNNWTPPADPAAPTQPIGEAAKAEVAAKAPTLAPQASPQAPAKPVDAFGTQAYMANLGKGVNQEMAGLQGLAAAEAATAQAQQKVLEQQAVNQQQTLMDFKTKAAALDKEINDWKKDLASQRINPNRYLGDMTTMQRVGTTIGLILGGIGGGLTRQGNPALEYLNKQIDRDIDAQKANLEQKNNLLAANFKQFGNMRDAADMTRVMLAASAQTELQLAAAKSGDEAAKARALQAVGQLNQKYAPVLSQIAMRQSLLDGVKAGRMDASTYLRAVVPENEKKDVAKEVAEAQALTHLRDNALAAFDKISQVGTLGAQALSPIDARAQKNALIEPLSAVLGKELAGRFTEADAATFRTLLSAEGRSAETRALQRQQLNKFLTEKMHFPMAEQYIPKDVLVKSQFNAAAQPKFKEMPPVLPSK